MLGYILFVGIITLCLLLVYCLINGQTAAIKLFRKILIRGTGHNRSELYLERFRENKQSNLSRNMLIQMLPWIGVLAVVVILGNQYFYFGTVLSGSMEPVFKRGDLVLMQTIDKEPKVGDIIMYTVSKFTSSIDEPITHRIISVDKNGDIRTKGDANSEADTWVLTKKNIMGKAVIIGGQPITIKGLGSILVPEAGQLSIMNKLPKGMEITMLFQRFRALQPLIILFATIFYFFILIETRADSEKRFSKRRYEKGGIKDRTKAP